MDDVVKMDRKEERRLIRKTLMGCDDAFEALMAANSDKLMAFIFKRGGKHVDHHELFQLTQIRAWKSLKNFKGDSSFYTWICRIATNLFIDNYRRIVVRNRTISMADVENGDQISFLDSLLAKNGYFYVNEGEKRLRVEELGAALTKCMNELSEDHRGVLKMFFLENMKYDDIAKDLKISIGTVMSRLFYAKRSARKIFKSRFNNYGFITNEA